MTANMGKEPENRDILWISTNTETFISLLLKQSVTIIGDR